MPEQLRRDSRKGINCVNRTDEERMIDRTVCRVLGLQDGKEICHEDEED